jgi:hypothetical protein
MRPHTPLPRNLKPLTPVLAARHGIIKAQRWCNHIRAGTEEQRHDRRDVSNNTLPIGSVAMRWEPHVGIALHPRDPALQLLARKQSHGILLAAVHQGAATHTWMRSCHPLQSNVIRL